MNLPAVPITCRVILNLLDLLSLLKTKEETVNDLETESE